MIEKHQKGLLDLQKGSVVEWQVGLQIDLMASDHPELVIWVQKDYLEKRGVLLGK